MFDKVTINIVISLQNINLLFFQGNPIRKLLVFSPPIVAVDQDLSINASILYSITNGNAFFLMLKQTTIFLIQFDVTIYYAITKCTNFICTLTFCSHSHIFLLKINLLISFCFDFIKALALRDHIGVSRIIKKKNPLFQIINEILS